MNNLLIIFLEAIIAIGAVVMIVRHLNARKHSQNPSKN